MTKLTYDDLLNTLSNHGWTPAMAEAYSLCTTHGALYYATDAVTIDDFINKRLEARSASKIAWPSKLSKKEVICCKLEYIEHVYKYLAWKPNEQLTTSVHADCDEKLNLLKSVIAKTCYITRKHILSKKAEKKPDGTYEKFKGLDPVIAKLLNTANSYITNYEAEPIKL